MWLVCARSGALVRGGYKVPQSRGVKSYMSFRLGSPKVVVDSVFLPSYSSHCRLSSSHLPHRQEQSRMIIDKDADNRPSGKETQARVRVCSFDTLEHEPVEGGILTCIVHS